MGLDTIKTFPAIPAPFPSNTSPLPAANYQTHHRWGSSKDHSHLKAFKSCCETFNARHVWQRPVADWSPEVLSLTELPGNTSWGKDPSHTQRFSPWKALWTCWGSSISVSQQIRRKQASSSFAETGFPLSFSERIVIFFFLQIENANALVATWIQEPVLWAVITHLLSPAEKHSCF